MTALDVTGSTPSTTAALLEALDQEGVSHVVGLPHNFLASLFDRLETHPTIELVGVAREGEAFAIAAGLWLGGKTPCVAVQNTGLLESGDALRGTASRMGVPLLALVSYRGHGKMLAAGLDKGSGLSRDELVARDIDSVALMTEATLNAWGVPYWFLDRSNVGPAVASAMAHARRQRRPVALLLSWELD